MNIEFEHEMTMHGVDVTVYVEASAHVYWDTYGADADGNRGEKRREIDDVKIVIKNMGGTDLTEIIRKRHAKDFREIEETADEMFSESEDL